VRKVKEREEERKVRHRPPSQIPGSALISVLQISMLQISVLTGCLLLQSLIFCAN